LANTSCSEAAAELLDQCLRGDDWDRGLLDDLLRRGCDDALFRVVAEGLADRFEPRLCRLYDQIFSRALGVPIPVRVPPVLRDYRRVFVLSRVTLGADVAVTSVILDAAKKRFPEAEPRKNWELFAADPRIGHTPVGYRRGAIGERMAHLPGLRAAVDDADSLVIDPDSRLTQLGLVPVCRPENYLFFESRSYGAGDADALPVLTSRWCRETLGVEGAPYIAVEPAGPLVRPAIAISLGTGENPNKRVADPFEAEWMRLLAREGAHLYIDAGAGGAEADRVARAIAGIAPERVHLRQASFADFAAIIQASDLYVGYDSAGQHVAAACRIPQLTVFAGEPCERMFQRWRPAGHDRIAVIRAKGNSPGQIIKMISEELASLSL
jgi:hypothetical protein